MKQVGCFNHRVVTLVADKLQERAHALAICKTSACMRKVNYIIVVDLTCTINRDLMVGKRPAALITTFFTKYGRKGKLISFVHLNKVRLV